MSSTAKYIIWLCLAALLIVCRAMDNHYQTQSEEFPIETCVKVNLVHGQIEYDLANRCTLVVKAFKAGRQSAVVLKQEGEK